jgi:serralysin
MAGSSMQYQPLTGDAFVDSMTTGFSWSLDGSRSLDYSVSNGIYGEYWFDPSSVSQYLGAALSLYANYANVSFSNLGLYSDPIAAANAGSEINVSLDASNLFFSSYNSWAVGFFPDSAYNSLLYEGAAGDIYINVNSGANYLPTYEPGSQGWFLLLHELGHTLGLKHPHDDGGTGRPTFSELGIGELDIDLATVMSYNDDAEWNQFSWDPATPMVLDVLALQYLYGKNQSTNSGNSVHSLNNFIGYYATLWDAGGEYDVVSVRDGFEGWLIELPEVTISSLSSERIGYAIPSSDLLYSVPTTLIWLVGDFEQVSGSVFSDVVVGNSLDNRFSLDAGDDVIFYSLGEDYVDGGAGEDTIEFVDLSLSDIQVFRTDYGTRYDYSVKEIGEQGKTTLSQVEFISVGGVSYSLSEAYELITDMQSDWIDTVISREEFRLEDHLTNTSISDAKSELVIGTLGRDTVYCSGSHGEYDVSWVPASNGNFYLRSLEQGTIDQMQGVDRVVFQDTVFSTGINGQNVMGKGALAFDFDGIGGKGYRIYKAAFNREPDPSGLGFWLDRLEEGMDLVEVSARFLDSQEFRDLYGNNVSHGEFLTAVYQNVLGRSPDQTGYAYWIDQLETNPEKTWQKVLADFSESPENVESVATLIADRGMYYVEYNPY